MRLHAAWAALLLACATKPDPAVGSWLCRDRVVDTVRTACPVDGRTWQLDLASSGRATFFETRVEDGAFREVALVGTRLRAGAWAFATAGDTGVSTDTAVLGEDLVMSCVRDAEALHCAGTDAAGTWELRFDRAP
ncbi:MAG: hypothetical protein H6737_19695 [Alphaproteobacteria bacterium]|nr:hypothetical protein [Alphaproteobacteria bacterium]